MKNKKLLSTILAASLAATTMAMPVMAAQEGRVDVTVEDEKGVLRVQVPTMLSVKIDPYEIAQAGCQIASSEFGMRNRSQMDVKVELESQITKAASSDLSFVSSKEAATASTTKGEAWVAIAAMTSGDPNTTTVSYDDPDTSGDAETFATLKETNKNVTTFSASGDAKQTFYLGKKSGDAINLTITYNKVEPAEDGKTGKEYAEYYELVQESSISGDAALKTVLATKDIYKETSGDATGTFQKFTKADIDDVSGDVEAGDTFYSISGDAIKGADTKQGKTYMYEEAEEGGTAGFRYIGNLSNADGKEWSKEDFGTITLNYTISGVSKTVYDSVEDDLVNGFYTKANGPQVTMTSDGTITMSGLTADVNYAHSAILKYGEFSNELDTDPNMDWGLDNWSADDGGTLIFKLSPAWLSALAGKSATVTVKLSNNSTIAATCQF